MRSGRHLRIPILVAFALLSASQAASARAAEPASPQGVFALPRDGAVGISFHGVPKASKYIIYRRQVGQEKALAVEDLNYSAYLVIDSGPDGKGLANGTPLFYSVAAVVDGVEGPASPEVVATPQVPLTPGFIYYDIGTLSPGQASLDGKTLTLRGSGNGIGDQGEGQTFLAIPLAGDFSLTAQLLQAPRVVSGADAMSTDEGFVGLEIRSGPGSEGLLPGVSYALIGAYVRHDPEVVFAGKTGVPGGLPQFFSSGETRFADARFPLFLRLQKAGAIVRAFQSTDGVQWEQVGDDQEFGPVSPVVYAGLVAAAHKEGAYVAGQFDWSTVSITSP